VPSIVLDASIVSAWCFADEQTAYTTSVFNSVFWSVVDAVAPRLWAYEVRNSVLMGLRRGRIREADADQFLLALNDANVRLTDPASYEDVFAHARRHQLTFYDAAYLNTAMREQSPLASLDRPLIRAAASEGVLLFQP
jgi:predicted nucleic acid-binding protein